jgi:PLP dependent protein
MDMTDRYEGVRLGIARAAERSGRDPSGVTLIAVSKTMPGERVREAFRLGIRDFGENKVQELLQKTSTLSDLPVRWHMIGHLQTNKVRAVVPLVTMIHSVDSAHLAESISKEVQPGKEIDILLQVNTSGEDSKFGVAPEQLPALAASIRPLDRLRVRGLMTLGPLTEDEAAIRDSFRRLRELLSALRDVFPGASVLSMGMSGDFEIAIEEGATHIRVGTALFGSRG